MTMLGIWVLGHNVLRTSDNPLDYVVNLLFLNGLVQGTANNNVVLGGWFVGTLTVFYLLFPFIHKLYFSLPKNRYVFFPLTISLLSFLTMYLMGNMSTSLYCANNSFAYFSFINQLPVFVLGFTLFDIVNRKIIVSYSCLKGVLLLFVTVWLFFSSFRHAFILVPVLFTISVVYFYVFFKTKRIDEDSKFMKVVLAFNKYSFPIYLTHTFVVWYGMQLVLKILKLCDLYTNPIFIYILFIPLIYWIVYQFGKLFAAYLQMVDMYINKFTNFTDGFRIVK